MPPTARVAVGGSCYHVLDRGNERRRLFHDVADYLDFVRLLRQACSRVPMRVIGYCLMPHHFHLVVWPPGDDDRSAWMQWLLTSHGLAIVCATGVPGHVWQGRFKAFPIEQDEHLLAVLRYFERNSLRADLVARAEQWQWSSLAEWQAPPAYPWLEIGPVPRPACWLEQVQDPQTEAELAALQRSVVRGVTYGRAGWLQQTAIELGLESTFNRPGRPAKGATVRAEGHGLFDEKEP
jgi:putative transposase